MATSIAQPGDEREYYQLYTQYKQKGWCELYKKTGTFLFFKLYSCISIEPISP